LGDAIEVNALKKAFSELYQQRNRQIAVQRCGLGSVKGNIGHLETAAGIASLIKTLQAIKYGRLPATLHLQTVNSQIDLEESPFYIVDRAQDWQRLSDEHGQMLPRRAGVSSFGFGGVNAHVVLEEHLPPTQSGVRNDETDHIIVLSSKTPEQLQEYAGRLALFLEEAADDLSLAGVAWTLQSGREVMAERLALVVGGIAELAAKLGRFSDNGGSVKGLHWGNALRESKDVDLLLDGEAGRAYMDISIQNRELDKLAALWVKGTVFNWRALYGDDPPPRISLPTYPFLSTSHWVPLSGFEPPMEDRPLDEQEYKLYYGDGGNPSFLRLMDKNANDPDGQESPSKP